MRGCFKIDPRQLVTDILICSITIYIIHIIHLVTIFLKQIIQLWRRAKKTERNNVFFYDKTRQDKTKQDNFILIRRGIIL